MRLEFIQKTEKKRIEEKLNFQFGISKLNYLLIKSGREKIRAYSGSLSKDELKKLAQTLRIEGIGLYFAKEEGDNLRLSIDAVNLLAKEISKNILEISEEQAKSWMRGENLDVGKELGGVFAVRFKDDFLGCGKAGDGKLYNFVPKERRVRG